MTQESQGRKEDNGTGLTNGSRKRRKKRRKEGMEWRMLAGTNPTLWRDKWMEGIPMKEMEGRDLLSDNDSLHSLSLRMDVENPLEWMDGRDSHGRKSLRIMDGMK